jgi:hypothetical protein
MNEDIGNHINGLTIEKATVVSEPWKNKEIHLLMSNGTTLIFHTATVIEENVLKIGLGLSLIDKDFNSKINILNILNIS